jgi:hypothetical protein
VPKSSADGIGSDHQADGAEAWIADASEGELSRWCDGTGQGSLQQQEV